MLYLVLGSVSASIFLFILHFFGLRLRQKLEFSHIQFLSALNAQTRSIRKINNVLLLLLRIIFVLAALAAFISFFLGSNSKTAVIKNGAVKIVIDYTWSMQSALAAEDVSKIFQAVKDAEKISEADIPAGSSNNNRKDAATGVGDNAKTSLSLPMDDLINSQLASSSESSTTYLFSDFQKPNYSEDILTDLSKKENLVLIPYASAGSNFYIDSVWLSEPVMLPQSNVQLKARISGSLQKENRQVAVQLKEQNKLLGTSQVLLEVGQQRILEFQVKADKAETRQLTFEIKDTENPFDNQFFVILPKPSEVQVKVLPDLPTNHPVLRAFKEEPAFRFADNGNSSGSLWVYEVGEGSKRNATVEAVKDWLEGGGNLLVLPNKGNQQPVLNFLSSIGLKGIREEAKGMGDKTMKQPDLSDFFFKSIFEKEVQNIKMPSAEPVLNWQSSFHTILRFTDNAPFLSTFKVENGFVHIFAASVNSTSSFAAHPLFVPVLYQLALNSSSVSALSYEPDNGNISFPAPLPVQAKEPYKLRGFSQIWIPQQQVIQNQLNIGLPEEISKPGFYEILRDEQVLGEIAINIPRNESKLESYSPEELRTFMADRNSNVKVLIPNGRVSLEKQLQSEESENSVWKYCLILCLLCLGIEAVILSAKKRGSLI